MSPAWKRLAFAAGGLAGVALLSAAGPRYTLVDFGPHTQGVDLNAAGDVVYYHAVTRQAFRFASGKSVELPKVEAGALLPLAMDDRGVIISQLVQWRNNESRRRVMRVFVFAGGEQRELVVAGLPDGVWLDQVVGLDNDGVVAALTNEQPARLAFVRAGKVGALLDVAAALGKHEFTVVENTRGNRAGVVVGSVSGSHWEKQAGYTAQALEALRGFVATERGVTDLGDFIPVAVSSSGRLIGRQLQPGDVSPMARAKLRPAWREGETVREFDGPPGFETGRFAAISPTGQIVGEGVTITGGGFLWIGQKAHVFLFTDGVWQDVNDLVTADGAKNYEIFLARRINERGQILCQAMSEGGFRAVLLTPVAEPTAAR